MAKERISIQISVEGLKQAEVLAIILGTASELHWPVQHLHPMRVVVHVPNKGLSGIAKVEVQPKGDHLIVSSSTVGWRPFAQKDRHDKILQLFMEKFAWTRVTMAPERLVEEINELERNGILQLDASTMNSDKFGIKDIATMFVPRAGFFTSALLIDLNVLIYLIMVLSGVDPISPGAEEVLSWGGNYRPVTLEGEWWRLMTCCFLHFGIVHLLMNIYAFTMVAVQLEPLLGRWRMLGLYLLTGIFASATSLWWNDNSVSAGASGAVFGMYGVFLALLMTDLIHREVRKPLLNSIGIFVVYNIIYGMKGNVDNAAHLGGLFSGLLFGFFTYLAFKRPQIQAIRAISIVMPTLLLAIVSVVAIAPLMNDDGAYQARLEAFYDNQEQGMIFFHMAEAGVTEEELVQEINDRSMPAWQANRELLYSLGQLELSPMVRSRHEELMNYCALRIEHFDLMRYQMKAGTDEKMSHRLAQVENDLSAVLNAMRGDVEE